MTDMKRYLITWDCGFGETSDIVEATSVDHAESLAYEAWKEDAENNAVYAAKLFTKEVAEYEGMDWEEDNE